MALFGFPPMRDADGNLPPPKTTFKAASLGALVSVFVVILIFMIIPRMSAGMMMGMGVIIVILLLTFIPAIILNLRGDTAEKPKREGQDIFALIDRMVDDLDEDELDYLRRRLTERTSEEKQAATETMDALLAQRTHEQRARKRE